MSDLRRLISELSKREMTRKQFLALVSGSFLGLMSLFRFLQTVNTPDDLATSDRGVFGEKEYGHTEQPPGEKSKGYNSEDVFG